MGVRELEAAAALYASAALEPLGPLQIVDRLLELWLARGLPMAATSGGSRALDRYWLQRNDRLTDAERRDVHAHVFDARFDELWTALVVALAQERADPQRHAEMLRAHLAARIDEQTLALTALLYAQLRAALDVLGERDILDAQRAGDMWQLIAHRARLDLGTEPDVARAQTIAATGSEIIAWLAAEQDGDVPDEVADAARSWLAVAARPP